MSKKNNLTDFLTNEANAIRTKKGYPSSHKINPQDFASEIASIESGIPSDFNAILARSSNVDQPYSITIKCTENAGTGSEALRVLYVNSNAYAKSVSLSEGETVTIPIWRYFKMMTIIIASDDFVYEAEIIDDVSGNTIALLNTSNNAQETFVVYNGVLYIVGTGADIA